MFQTNVSSIKFKIHYFRFTDTRVASVAPRYTHIYIVSVKDRAVLIKLNMVGWTKRDAGVSSVSHREVPGVSLSALPGLRLFALLRWPLTRMPREPLSPLIPLSSFSLAEQGESFHSDSSVVNLTPRRVVSNLLFSGRVGFLLPRLRSFPVIVFQSFTAWR